MKDKIKIGKCFIMLHSLNTGIMSKEVRYMGFLSYSKSIEVWWESGRHRFVSQWYVFCVEWMSYSLHDRGGLNNIQAPFVPNYLLLSIDGWVSRCIREIHNLNSYLKNYSLNPRANKWIENFFLKKKKYMLCCICLFE